MAHRLSTQLAGKSAFVTGAGRGIGRGIALILAERGADVFVTDLDGDSASKVATEIRAIGRESGSVPSDVTDKASIAEAAQKAISELGKIDICVANAGVIGSAGLESRDHYVDEDWEATYQVNVKGLANTADAVWEHMRERRRGRIINIASQGGRAPRGPRLGIGESIVPYWVSKAAAIQWTHMLAQQMGPHNVTVNAVCPGTLWTPIWEKIALSVQGSSPELAAKDPYEIFMDSIKARQPIPRPQTPEDIGRAVAFFASDDASEINGQALNVNGGAIMS